MIDDLKRLVIKQNELIDKIKTSSARKQKKYTNKFKKQNDKIPTSLRDIQVNGKNIPKLVEQNVVAKKAPKAPPAPKQKPSKNGSEYVRFANKLFLKTSEKFVPVFSSLEQDLKRSNLGIILVSYISTMLFSVLLSFVASLMIFTLLLVANPAYWIHFWYIIIVPILTFVFFYIYPSSEVTANEKEITYELPFATIHMAAIAMSDVEPTKIFKIISSTNDYSHVGREMKKIVAQVEIYGYDLVTSLKNVASRISNDKMAELLGGLAINISTGGELKAYLEKKAESYLNDYRLTRKKYIDIAGTFMDIYIAILIATPLILVLMFVLMNVSGIGFEGVPLSSLMFIAIGVVIVLNIIFLFILNIKQPKV